MANTASSLHKRLWAGRSNTMRMAMEPGLPPKDLDGLGVIHDVNVGFTAR